MYFDRFGTIDAFSLINLVSKQYQLYPHLMNKKKQNQNKH
jgi:hypothetical protein